jgi:hypothetical protein
MTKIIGLGYGTMDKVASRLRNNHSAASSKSCVIRDDDAASAGGSDAYYLYVECDSEEAQRMHVESGGTVSAAWPIGEFVEEAGA